MRVVILVALTLMIASVAIAAEKQTEPDVQLPALQNRAVFAGALDGSSPTWNRSFGPGTFAGDCAVPMSDSSNDGQYYAVFCIQVTDSSPIEIIVDAGTTEVTDTTMHLFCDPFDAADPLTNVNFYDDDGGDGLYSAFLLADNVTLVPNTDYHLVVSTFGPDDMGAFFIDTSDNVMECSVSTENLDWGSLKASYR